ncbi:NAD(P)-binding domain-containing protein [Embleya sp. NBC_00888]|uniref:NAD(P)-dependent oxidoreductase n=1 Tax=Embleya sp. NBC_00888 TaxID=2975960 RepID=UPI00386F9342|nr:NAD(P)-binding domain-containing protein [Embleya sp. NBC_00888]
MNVSLLGTGLMGSALAHALLRNGARVTVWNRTATKCAPVAAAGAAVAESARSAVQANPVTIVCLLDYDVVRAVLAECGPLTGRTIVNTATGSPAEATAFAEWIEARGALYLDGAIAAYPEDIGTETSGINYSGSTQAWEALRDLLLPVAAQSRFVGTRPGAANVLDAAMAGAFFNVALGAFHEAASYARAEGVAVAEMRHSLHLWTGKLLELLQEAVDTFETRDYSTDQATLHIYAAAVKSWHESMLHAGQSASLMAANLANLERACAAGYGDMGLFAQIETLSPRSATTTR